MIFGNCFSNTVFHNYVFRQIFLTKIVTLKVVSCQLSSATAAIMMRTRYQTKGYVKMCFWGYAYVLMI